MFGKLVGIWSVEFFFLVISFICDKLNCLFIDTSLWYKFIYAIILSRLFWFYSYFGLVVAKVFMDF